MPRKIIATTDVLAHDNRFLKGTGFVVVDHPDPKAKVPEVDETTALGWERLGWADRDPGKDKPHAG